MLALNGPVVTSPTRACAGCRFFRTGSLAEARRLYEQDPLFLAGRFEYEVDDLLVSGRVGHQAGTPVQHRDLTAAALRPYG